jgi:hypothetical protein
VGVLGTIVALEYKMQKVRTGDLGPPVKLCLSGCR